MSQDGFRQSVAHIIEAFIKRRQTKFANTHHCTVADVHVHNAKPIWFLVKKFKEQNGIKSRVFKSLTAEQQTEWVKFYDANKDLKVMTNDEHKQFHDGHTFNVKTESWVESPGLRVLMQNAAQAAAQVAGATAQATGQGTVDATAQATVDPTVLPAAQAPAPHHQRKHPESRSTVQSPPPQPPSAPKHGGAVRVKRGAQAKN